jgi:ribosomal protein L11 methyltransferase
MRDSDIRWPQIVFRASRPLDAELIETALEAAHALAITMTDAADVPIYEPDVGEHPLWQDTLITGLFEPETDWQSVLANLHHSLPAAVIESAELTEIPDQDWIRAWMDQFKPMQFGNNTWIVPTHYQPPEPNAVNISLDPGLAFGTGTHPTTAMCLQWIDQQAPLTKDRVLDYGTGSGILAIAARKHGATLADAVDIDPQALVATIENAERNQIDNISIFLPQEFTNTTPYPIVLANILAGPLIELAPYLANQTQIGGFIVLAGLREDQRQQVWQAYADYFTDPEFKSIDGWVRISATRV